MVKVAEFSTSANKVIGFIETSVIRKGDMGFVKIGDARAIAWRADSLDDAGLDYLADEYDYVRLI